MNMMEVVLAYGHGNIQAMHRSTLEITKKTRLSRRGDCIIAVSADKALADLSLAFKDSLRSRNAKMTVLIETGEAVEVVKAMGSPRLVLTHRTDMVVRRSDYICDRTLAIKADKAAYDLSRELAEKLRNPNQEVKITLTVDV